MGGAVKVYWIHAHCAFITSGVAVTKIFNFFNKDTTVPVIDEEFVNLLSIFEDYSDEESTKNTTTNNSTTITEEESDTKKNTKITQTARNTDDYTYRKSHKEDAHTTKRLTVPCHHKN